MSKRRRQQLKLLAGVVAIVVLWTLVLPWIGRQAPVNEMIIRNEARGIDPTAMFYTELANMHFEQGMLRYRETNANVLANDRNFP